MSDAATAPRPAGEALAGTRSSRGRLHPSGALGATLLLVLAAMTLFAPWLSPRGPTDVDLRRRLEAPSWSEPFGTDELGRSTLARVVHGGRSSLLAAVVVALVAAVAGVGLGALAATLRGAGDAVIMRFIDGMLACPPLVLALAVIAVLGSGLLQAAVALVIVEVPVFARLTRGVMLGERDRQHVEAAVASGASPLRVTARHVLPAAIGAIVVQATLATGFAVVALSGVSFLGLGVQPPHADWGEMLARSRDHLLDAPWLALAPGAAVIAAVLGCNLLGDALRDVVSRGR